VYAQQGLSWRQQACTELCGSIIPEDDKLAKPNYQYEKRQKDLARRKKQDEKRQRKLNKGNSPRPEEGPAQTPGEGTTTTD
jgi:hypothetical protein